MLGLLTKIFSSGVVGSVERVASEWIETDKESAEAKAMMVKTLDPNGIMRRELSRFACFAYGFYLVVATALVMAHSFGWGDNPAQTKEAMASMMDLFLPITGAWTTIVSASFGVNYANVKKDK